MKQQIIAKFAKKFAYKAPKTDKNNILEGVNYATDGSVFITNRHYGLRIKNAHKLESPVTIHATKGVPIEGVYPDISRLFPESFDIEICLSSVSLATSYAKYVSEVASKIDRKHPIASICVIEEEGSLVLSAQTDDKLVKCEAILSYTDIPPALFGRRCLNANYMLTALEVFTEFNAKQVFLKTNENVVAPIIISDNADIDVIILPYRNP